MSETTRDFLTRSIVEMEMLQREARKADADRLALFVYLLDMAIGEAREQWRQLLELRSALRQRGRQFVIGG